jgi:hypothetical protein
MHAISRIYQPHALHIFSDWSSVDTPPSSSEINLFDTKHFDFHAFNGTSTHECARSQTRMTWNRVPKWYQVATHIFGWVSILMRIFCYRQSLWLPWSAAVFKLRSMKTFDLKARPFDYESKQILCIVWPPQNVSIQRLIDHLESPRACPGLVTRGPLVGLHMLSTHALWDHWLG